MRAAAEATSDSLVRIHETSAGDRVYLLRRGGRFWRVQRAFRDDQLAAGRILFHVSAEPGVSVAARLNDEPIGGPLRPGPRGQDVVLALPRTRVRRGLNVLELSTGARDAELELSRVESR
jgi:hypothetical protein